MQDRATAEVFHSKHLTGYLNKPLTDDLTGEICSSLIWFTNLCRLFTSAPLVGFFNGYRIDFSAYASVNSNCALPPLPLGNCGAFARLVSPGGGALANLARPGGRAFPNPGDNPEKFVDILKVFFLNFNMYFNLKSHNFKANSESVYK